MKVVVSILILIGILSVIGFLFLSQSGQQKQLAKESDTTPTKAVSSPTEHVDYKASFAIFTNGTFRIFTDTRYHNLSPDVYLTADTPNIIYVKTAGITWDDFFKTLPMSLTKQCLITGTKQTFCTDQNGTLQFYLNGSKTDDFLSREIQPGDKALITYGTADDATIKAQLQQIPDPQ